MSWALTPRYGRPTPASVEEVAERLVEAFNGRDIEAVLALVDDEVEFNFGNKTLHVARDGRLKRYAEFPDLASALAASSVSEADDVSRA